MEEDLMREGDSEGLGNISFLFLFDEDYLASTCMGVVSGERFCTINKESCNFGSHGRVKFEIKSGFIYLQKNTTFDIQSPCFDTPNIPKYRW